MIGSFSVVYQCAVKVPALNFLYDNKFGLHENELVGKNAFDFAQTCFDSFMFFFF